MKLQLTSRNLLLTLKEFISVWINQILYYNRIYSQEVFDRKKSFNLIVFQNRNPKLQSFIEKLTNDFLEVLIGRETGGSKVNQISVNIFNQSTGAIIERYVLHFNDVLVHLGKTLGSQFNDVGEDRSSLINIPGITWDEIYTQFSSVLYEHLNELKIHHQNLESPSANSEDHELDLFFKILIELDETVRLVNTDWVRVNSSRKVGHTFKSIGEVSLSLINLDIHNEYY